MKSSDVIDMLVRHHFNDPSTLELREFRPSMGWKGEHRWIDLWVLQLSPAKGMLAHSVEVKVSRSDWLRELKQPLKRRPMEAVSNFAWVAAPPGIVAPHELPAGWGLFEVFPDAVEDWNRVKQQHPADHRDKVRPTWAFVGSALACQQRNAKVR